jgi:hypothetical protein
MERHADTVIETTFTPQEDSRLQVPRSWLDQYMALIAKVVPLACCELIYSIDKTGFSYREDWPTKLLASTESFGPKLH